MRQLIMRQLIVISISDALTGTWAYWQTSPWHSKRFRPDPEARCSASGRTGQKSWIFPMKTKELRGAFLQVDLPVPRNPAHPKSCKKTKDLRECVSNGSRRR